MNGAVRYPIGRWRELGPFVIDKGLGATGRVMAIAVDPTYPETIYAGSVSSSVREPGGCGVWKTNLGGSDWYPITDNLGSLQVAAIAIDPVHPSRVYVATLYPDRSGAGLYRSSDGGLTWTRVAYDGRLNGRTLLISPWNTDVLYMTGGEDGKPYGFSSGVYQSTDGGGTWTEILHENGGVITDLLLDQRNPGRLYAGVQGQTTEIGGVYATRDTGSTWVRLTGCPQNELPDARTGTTVRLAISGSRIYAAFKTSSDWTLYRTTGKECAVLGRPEQAWERGWEAGPEVSATLWSFIYADPSDPDFVYATGTNFRVSTDGGRSFSVVSGPHVDHHAFATDPTDPRIIYTGCDGGIYRSSNRGASGSWSFIGQGMTNTEMYDLAHAPTDESVVVAGTQDNGTIMWYGSNYHWKEIRDGDGAGVDVDPTNQGVIFGVGQYANSIARSKGGGNFESIAQGLPMENICFDMPFHVHPTKTHILLASCNGALWRTTTPTPPGDWGKIFEPGTGGVTCSGVDPVTDMYVAGTTGGELFAAPGGVGWTRIFSYPGYGRSGAAARVSDIQFDEGTPGTMFATFDADDPGFLGYIGRVFRLNVRGTTATAQDITSDLPGGVAIRTLAVDRMRQFSVFVGAIQGGVHHGTSADRGTTWKWGRYTSGQLPEAADVRKLLVHPISGVLRAATFGRGAFEVDTDWPLGSVLQMDGRVVELRAHERASMFGPATDRIDVEVVFRLDADRSKAFGLQLRDGASEAVHRGMLDVLRDAFRTGGRVRVDYSRAGFLNNVAIRVIRVS